MKLLFITNNFPPIIDGVGDYTFHLANELVKHNNEVHILCSNKPEIKKKANELVLRNIFVHPIILKWNKNGINLAYKKIKEISPNWISLQYVPYAFNKYGIPFWISKLIDKLYISNQKTITLVHEAYIWRKDEINPKNYTIYLLQKYYGNNIFKKSNKLITSLKFYKDILIKHYNKKTNLIPIGSNIIKPTNISPEELLKLKKSYQTDSKEKIIVLFGVRDTSMIMKSQSILQKKGYSIKILGIGKHKTTNQPSNNIIYTGPLSNDDIYKHLAMADVFIMPEKISHNNEGGASLKSGSLAAALMCGLPIITNKGNLTDLDLIHKNNIYFTPYSIDGFVTAIIELIDNKPLNETLRKNALITYQNQLTWKIIAQKVLDTIINETNN